MEICNEYIIDYSSYVFLCKYRIWKLRALLDLSQSVLCWTLAAVDVERSV